MAMSIRCPRLLAVADKPRSAQALAKTTMHHSYEVRTAVGGREALAAARDYRPDLVIADLSAPPDDAFELWRFLREHLRASIIVLSNDAEERAAVQGLDAGADYYLTKPVGADELMARVRAVLRRRNGDPGAFAIGDFRVDPETCSVRVRGVDTQLTPKEFELFAYMARRPRCVLEHRTLLVEIWGQEACSQTEYLRVFIAQLRRKLEPKPSRPRYLVTEPWVGYYFDPGPETVK
jgi:two-component system, OmpR family, KDP operon response regulator KdpE